MSKRIDLTNKKFGRWLALYQIPSQRGTFWHCQCKCGTERTIEGKSLRNGRSKSCGCFKKELAAKRMRLMSTKHGLSSSRIYSIYKSMMARCYNPNSNSYPRYGGRGITVAKEWHSFEAFFKDMGFPLSTDTIERIDNEKGYSKNNCIWLNAPLQNRNKRNNILITANNETHLMADWSRITGIKIGTLWGRYNAGWSDEQIINVPVRKKAVIDSR